MATAETGGPGSDDFMVTGSGDFMCGDSRVTWIFFMGFTWIYHRKLGIYSWNMGDSFDLAHHDTYNVGPPNDS